MGRARALTLVLSVTAVLGSFAPAMASSSPAPADSYRSRGVSAWASWEECSEDFESCRFLDLYAFEGMEKSEEGVFKGTRVCLFVYPAGAFGAATSFPVEETESGCSTAPRGTLEVAKDISSARLYATKVELYRCTFDYETEEEVCDPNPSRVVRVAARWNGRGPTFEESSRYTFRVGECSETYADKGTFRRARARARFAGEDLGRTRWAGIQKGWTTFRSTCPYSY